MGNYLSIFINGCCTKILSMEKMSVFLFVGAKTGLLETKTGFFLQNYFEPVSYISEFVCMLFKYTNNKR